MSARESVSPGIRGEAAKLAPGLRLGRYELLRPMAEGGMAAVWLAHQHGPHDFRRLVAVKTILPHFASEPGFREMFLDEASVASRITHENVGEVIDLGEDQGVLYLVMEWIEGDSLLRLEQTLARKGLSLPDGIILRILSDACAGLHAAHGLVDREGRSLGVVHRDVSPQNLLITSDGATKLIDFGVAKARGRLSRETAAGMVKGKLAYMAPEQALGMPLDRRADVWAVGAIFYRIVKGKPPYAASNPVEAMALLETGQLKDPLSASRGIHPAIIQVVEKSLSPSPNGRFATADAMRVALEGAMVKAGVATTAGDVAAFADAHLHVRRDARREAIRVALQEATQRNAKVALPTTRVVDGAARAEGDKVTPSRPALRTARESHQRLAAIVAEIEAIGATASRPDSPQVEHGRPTTGRRLRTDR